MKLHKISQHERTPKGHDFAPHQQQYEHGGPANFQTEETLLRLKLRSLNVL